MFSKTLVLSFRQSAILFARAEKHSRGSTDTLKLGRRLPDGHLRWLRGKVEETLSSLITKSTKRFNDLLHRNMGRGLVNHLLKVANCIHPRLSSSVVLQIVRFTRKCFYIHKHQGTKGLTLYLKACQVLLQQSIGKYIVKDIKDLKARPKRNRYGSPLIIHRSIRPLIHTKYSKTHIMLWMTLLGIFRVLEFKGKLSLDTITKPFELNPKTLTEWRDFILNDFKQTLLRGKLPSSKSIDLYPISTSSPTSIVLKGFSNRSPSVISTHFASLWLGAKLWMQSTIGLRNIETLSKAMGGEYFVERLRMIGGASPPFFEHLKNDSSMHILDDSLEPGSVPVEKELPRPNGEVIRSSGMLGRLSLKFEAAGKIRVFAMVDAWTQWLLKPLHEAVFSILETWSTDGTFNQVSPVDNLIHRVSNPTGHVAGRTFYSLDLSAATDRLPISLQVPIVSLIYDLVWRKNRTEPLSNEAMEFGECWRSILVDRSYYLFISKSELKLIEGPCDNPYKLRYAVGQPMGALSSWALLAITHHAIIAFSAKRAKVSRFRDYAVLGDDVVIANSKVANAYLRFLREIGVGVGLAKSIISKRKVVLEFAKKFFVLNEQMNMIPIKDCLTTWISNALVKEFAVKWKLTLPQVFSFLGFGYKSKHRILNANIWNVPSRARVNLIWLLTPGTHLGRGTWFEWITITSARESKKDVTTRQLRSIQSILIDIAFERCAAYFDTYSALYESMESLPKLGEEWVPITRNRMVQSSGSDMIHFETIRVPMDLVLRSPLDKSADYSFDGKDSRVHTGMVKHTFDKAPKNPLEDLMYTLYPIREKYLSFVFKVYHMTDDEIKESIEELCAFIFTGNEWEDRLTREAWPTSRSVARVFEDFNRVFALWVRIGKVLWTESKSKAAAIAPVNVVKELEGNKTPKSSAEDSNCFIPKKNQPSIPSPTIQVGDEWTVLRVVGVALSYAIFFFGMILLLYMVKEPNFKEITTPIIREVILEKNVAIDHLSDWITWVLILIIVILLGYAVYQYTLPPATVVDKTQESILSTQIERLSTLNSELESRLEMALNNIRALQDSNSSLLSDLKNRLLEISRLEVNVNTFSSKIDTLQSKVSAYSDTISKLRVDLSILEKETVPSATFEATGKLLANVQSELHTMTVGFNNLASTVRESGHVPNFIELDQYWSNFECTALTCLEQIGSGVNLPQLLVTLNLYQEEELTRQISKSVCDDLLKVCDLLHTYFQSHADLIQYSSDFSPL